MKVGLLHVTDGPSADADERIWLTLAEGLIARGVDAELVPVGIEQAELDEFDLVVSGRAPAWDVSHANHVIYVLPRSRAEAPPAAASLTDARAIAAWSESAARWVERLAPGRSILVARPKQPSTERIGAAPTTSTCIVSTRLGGAAEDADLALAAFADFPDADARLVIETNDGTLPPHLASDPRVEPVPPLSDTERAERLAIATAALLPGDATMASPIAAAALEVGCPIVTTTASSGLGELIDHGVSGMLMDPTPERLSWALRHIADNPRVRWEMSLNARRIPRTAGWTSLLDDIEELLHSFDRPRVLALSTYGVEPMLGGGPRRVRHLLRSIARHANVTLLVSSNRIRGTRRRRLEPGFEQVEVGRSEAQVDAEVDLYHALGRVPVDDVIAARLSAATPAFGRELVEQLDQADIVIGEHPFLLPLVGDTGTPVVHDSHNVEAELKRDLFAPHGSLGQWLSDAATEAERTATTAADLVIACTDTDLATLSIDASNARPGLVVENGVDTTALPLRQPGQKRLARAEVLAVVDRPTTDLRPLGLFIGSWHMPNIEAGRLVLDLAVHRPDWLFVLAGSHTSEFAGESLPENVSFIPTFAESLLWPLIAGADVALNPMVSGGGSNLKVYDYLSVGVPVLTTDVGARGLGGNADLTTVAAPTVDALSAGLDEARRSSDESPGRSAAGRALVEERHDWRHLGERWSTAVLSLIDAAPTPARVTTHEPAEPILSTTPPPPSDPLEALMEHVGAIARLGVPTPLDTSIDPTLREHLSVANENRFVGQHLPADARMRSAKQVVVRVGKALSNEQVHYNEALLAAAEHMAEQLHDQQRRISDLEAEIARLRNERTSPDEVDR